MKLLSAVALGVSLAAAVSLQPAAAQSGGSAGGESTVGSEGGGLSNPSNGSLSNNPARPGSGDASDTAVGPMNRPGRAGDNPQRPEGENTEPGAANPGTGSLGSDSGTDGGATAGDAPGTRPQNRKSTGTGTEGSTLHPESGDTGSAPGSTGSNPGAESSGPTD